MKTLSGPTLAHLQRVGVEATTFAVFWKITRSDGLTQGFTSHVYDIDYDGVTYKAASGILPSNVQQTTGKGVDNINIVGLLSSPDLETSDLLNGFYDDARVQVFLQSYEDLSLDPIVLVSGFVGEVKLGKVTFDAEVRSLMTRLLQPIGNACSPLCRADVYDAKCGVDPVPYTFSGSVSLAISKSQFKTNTAGIVGKPFTYFAYGVLEWTSGPNNGKKIEVRVHDTSSPMTFTLMEAMATAPAPGDTFTVKAGCDGTPATCKNKFGNIVRFRGEPFIPGADFVLRKVAT